MWLQLPPVSIAVHASVSVLVRYTSVFVEACDPQYLKNSNNNSNNLVLLRCAVAVGRTYYADGPMRGITQPPHGYDSVSQQVVLQAP